MKEIKKTVQTQHNYFRSDLTRDVDFRLEQLRILKNLLQKHEEEIIEAVRQDFNKAAFETYATEIGILHNEIDHILKHLKNWVKPERVRGSLINFPSRNYIHHQPYGVSLVIGAWNYPIQLSLNPVLGSIAAGNCTLIKPSELAAESSILLAKIINDNFNPGYLRVVEGGAETTQALLEQPLDYIFFTGSTRVGKIIMEAAAKQLTPVTLELGGKSPAIIDETADLKVAARRIVWGKFVNAGQTCVAPDYLYVHKSVKQELADFMIKEVRGFYGPEPHKSPDYARIINRSHFDRLVSYLDNGHILSGGSCDAESLYIEPTILDDISWNDAVMQEEIFGPILPILEYEQLKNLFILLNDRPKPLALYLFSKNTETQKQVVEKLSFGGGCINDTIAHLGNHNLPFGGIGNSGMGSYHGKSSFDVFSHEKSIMKKPTWLDIPLRYAPYKDNLKWIKKLMG